MALTHLGHMVTDLPKRFVLSCYVDRNMRIDYTVSKFLGKLDLHGSFVDTK